MSVDGKALLADLVTIGSEVEIRHRLMCSPPALNAMIAEVVTYTNNLTAQTERQSKTINAMIRRQDIRDAEADKRDVAQQEKIAELRKDCASLSVRNKYQAFLIKDQDKQIEALQDSTNEGEAMCASMNCWKALSLEEEIKSQAETIANLRGEAGVQAAGLHACVAKDCPLLRSLRRDNALLEQSKKNQYDTIVRYMKDMAALKNEVAAMREANVAHQEMVEELQKESADKDRTILHLTNKMRPVYWMERVK